MKTTYRFMGLFGCLACLEMGGSAYADNGNLRNVISDNLGQYQAQTTSPEILPDLAEPEAVIRDGMLFVPPRPDVDYKIGKVTPDPGIDYKIKIIAPKLRGPLMELGSRLEGIIREDVPRK